ncbi:type II secretion system F family protein [Luethyella okanaganae]|uniref:Type II secretion system F family protein n=1 Tax=Luethyella okanaganae TaxID=69372 RepID=A0ABW1VDM8_9MICO
MSGNVALALFCGVTLGLGLWSLVAMIPRLSRPRLVDRVAPYVVDISDAARERIGRTTVEPLPVLGALFAPTLAGSTRLLASMLGGSDTLARRLRQAGSSASVVGHRGEQLSWALAGLALGLLAVLFVPAFPELPLAARFALPLVFAVSAGAMRDWTLHRAARARIARMASELPTILEFLTLSLSAGEGLVDAVRRVARTGSGELAGELAAAVTRVNTGIPLGRALAEMSDGLGLPALDRCVDQMVGALDRGSPLVEVLRAQAQDAREEAKRTLLETAGKKEVAMLLPLVFLILPTTIVFAIFPGVFVLQAGF